MAISVAQMTSDLEQLADGDNTEIGEKGVNLSVGSAACCHRQSSVHRC